MLTSWSEVSTPAELSMASVLICGRPSAASTRPRWVTPRLAPSPTTLARSSSRVDADRVVGAVADLGVALARRLDVGADAAETEQVDRRLAGSRASVRPASVAGWSMPSARLASRRQDDRLGGAVEHAAARRDQALVVVGPGRARQVEQPLALGPRAPAGSGSGSMKMWRWLKAASSLVCCDSSMPLPNTSPDMSPTPTTVNGVLWMSRPQLAEMALHRLPGAARGDAHLLVVVAGRAARGEGVVQPEAVFARQRIGDVGEGGGALVGGDHEIGIVAVVAHARRPARRRAVDDSCR